MQAARCSLLVLIFLAESRAFRLPHIRKPPLLHAGLAQCGLQVPFGADVERLKGVALAALASVALVASPMPAYAKGGGHGGGGGGHSSHHSSSSSSRPSYPKSSSLVYRTSSRSSSRRSSGSSRRSSGSYAGSSSSYYDDRNLRIFPTDAMAREGGGLVCPSSLPTVGSKVDVVGIGTATVLQSRPALQSDLYPTSPSLIPGLQQPLPPGFDGGCTLSVQYKDGSTDTISAAQMPKSEFEEAADIILPPVTLAAYIILLAGGSPSSSSSAFEDFDTILSDVLDAKSPTPDRATEKILTALSGEFWGGSEGESDGGDQSIRVTLRFESNGRIAGRGHDGEDGSYIIRRGRWVREVDGRLWVAWEEKYDEGFSAICIGHIDASSGKVNARFASSRRVTGAFKLSKKPSVF